MYLSKKLKTKVLNNSLRQPEIIHRSKPESTNKFKYDMLNETKDRIQF